jgi:large subunit ribosomal protein LX
MSENKIYKITGEIMKKHFFEPMTFSKEIAATKESHALEKVYAEMGSRHRAKRFQIKIDSIKELTGEES